MLQRWEHDFHIEYPAWYDRSWAKLQNALFRSTLVRAIQRSLNRGEVFTEEEMKLCTEILRNVFKLITTDHDILVMTRKQWAKLFADAASKRRSDAPLTVVTLLAMHTKRAIAFPVPAMEKEDPASVKP
jgi:hypothetical protein